MICPVCGCELVDEAVFCHRCGTSVQVSAYLPVIEPLSEALPSASSVPSAALAQAPSSSPSISSTASVAPVPSAYVASASPSALSDLPSPLMPSPQAPSLSSAPLPTDSGRRRGKVGAWGFAALVVAAAAVFLGVWAGQAGRLITPMQALQTPRETLVSVNDLPLSSSDVMEASEAQPEGFQNSYAYYQLDVEDQAKYRTVLGALERRERLPYPAYDIDDCTRITGYVYADHPELNDIAIPNLSTGDLFTPAFVEGRYYIDESEQMQLMLAFAAARVECLSLIPVGADDYTKAKVAYEWIASTTEYDHDAAEAIDAGLYENTEGDPVNPAEKGQNVSNVLLDHRAVCAGYARAYEYLLQSMGIQCVLVTGDIVDGGPHGWCLARLDGAYYYIDPTWGDPEYVTIGPSDGYTPPVSYDFLAVTSSDMASSHVADDAIPLPDCISMADNYYVREGLYFETADIERLGQIVSSLPVGEEYAVTIRCADEAVYDDFLYNWFETGELGRFTESGSYRYGHNDQHFYLLKVSAA